MEKGVADTDGTVHNIQGGLKIVASSLIFAKVAGSSSATHPVFTAFMKMPYNYIFAGSGQDRGTPYLSFF